jgi:hypothetical protein
MLWRLYLGLSFGFNLGLWFRNKFWIGKRLLTRTTCPQQNTDKQKAKPAS